MAQIAIDLGNTFAKAGKFQGHELVSTVRFQHDIFEQIREWLPSQAPDQVIIGSVIALPAEFVSALREITEVLILDDRLTLPVYIGYNDPSELGKDRIAAAVAAASLFPQENILSIDLGSCITYDFVNQDEVFEGGSISPGLQMRLRAMHQFTEQLPNLEGHAFSSVPLVGKSTKEGMLSGVINGILNEIDCIIDAYQAQDSSIRVIIGGGDAPFFENNLKNAIFAEPELVLKGLNQIRHFNVS